MSLFLVTRVYDPSYSRLSGNIYTSEKRHRSGWDSRIIEYEVIEYAFESWGITWTAVAEIWEDVEGVYVSQLNEEEKAVYRMLYPNIAGEV